MAEAPTPEARFCIRCGTPLALQEHMGEIRPTCPRCGWRYFEDPKVAVAVLVTDDHNRVLLVRRRVDPHKGKWTLPSGFLNAREDPREAAHRECLEETGLDVEIGPLLTLLTGREHAKGADLLLVYQGRLRGGRLHAADDVDDARFFPPDALPDLAFASTQRILRAFWMGSATQQEDAPPRATSQSAQA